MKPYMDKCKGCGRDWEGTSKFCSNSCYLAAVSKYKRKLKEFRERLYREIFGS